MSKKWPLVGGGILVLVLGIGMGAAAGESNTEIPKMDPAPASAEAAPYSPVQLPAPPEPAVPDLDKFETPKAPPVPAVPDSFGDGTYEVPADMPAGKYKTTGPQSDASFSMCYSERAKDSSGELDSIITNDISQGQSVLTVNKGEVVTFSGGCLWTPQ